MTDKEKYLKLKDIEFDLNEDMAYRILFNYITDSWLTATRGSCTDYHVEVYYKALDVMSEASE